MDDKNINNLKKLSSNLDDFEKAFVNLVNISLQINNINILGTMREYPFVNSLDNIEIMEWISKFRKNIDNEIMNELLKEGKLTEKAELDKKFRKYRSSITKIIKECLDNFEGKAFYIVKANNSNANKYLYTEEFCKYLEKEIICRDKEKKNKKRKK